MGKIYNKCRYLLFLWIVYVAVDGLNTMVRSITDRRMRTPMNIFFRGTTLVRSVIIFCIAILNYILIFRKKSEM